MLVARCSEHVRTIAKTFGRNRTTHNATSKTHRHNYMCSPSLPSVHPYSPPAALKHELSHTNLTTELNGQPWQKPRLVHVGQ